MSNTAPDYDAYQTSFHRAFRTELYGALDTLPVPPHAHILDVPCGNGFYSRHLAERLGPGGRLIAVDASARHVRGTRAALRGTGCVAAHKANAYELPFPDATFDLIWCAQSLISLEPHRVASELLRVVKRDGVVAVLEVDEFHHVLLPWPAELEAALTPAMHAACVQKYGEGEKRAPARKLRGVLSGAGFGSVRRVTHPFDRAAPFDRPTGKFLARYFDHLRAFAYPHLSPRMRRAFNRETDPDGPRSLHHRAGVDLVCVNALYLARPAPPPGSHQRSHA